MPLSSMKKTNMKRIFTLMKRISSFLLFMMMFDLISCQKCRECETKRKGVIVHTEDWCWAGPMATENLKQEEDAYRQIWNGPDDVVTCRDK